MYIFLEYFVIKISKAFQKNVFQGTYKAALII